MTRRNMIILVNVARSITVIAAVALLAQLLPAPANTEPTTFLGALKHAALGLFIGKMPFALAGVLIVPYVVHIAKALLGKGNKE